MLRLCVRRGSVLSQNQAAMSTSRGQGRQSGVEGPCAPGTTMSQMAAELALHLDPYHNKTTLHNIDVVNDFAASRLMLSQEL